MMPPPDQTITATLARIAEGQDAGDLLLQSVYAELKRMARGKLAAESDMVTMGATGLVHEAWLRVSTGSRADFQNRKHFFAAAAEAMRRILIERARALGRQKRGQRATRITLDDAHGQHTDGIELLALDLALDELEKNDRQMAAVVKLRYFCGLGVAAVAELLEVSPRPVDRLWQRAAAWRKIRLAWLGAFGRSYRQVRHPEAHHAACALLSARVVAGRGGPRQCQ